MTSPRKTSSALNLIPEEVEEKMNPKTSKSCESLYSNSSKGSARYIYSRRPNAPLINKPFEIGAARQATIIPATSEVRQRVLSARRLRMKTFQNQLADAQQTIAELAHEIRILRTLNKRQDSALSKYEANNAELPQLLQSHQEELKAWKTRYRNLQATNKELEQKLKQKEALILLLSDQNKYFTQLNKDKSLGERQRLTEKLHSFEVRLQEKDNDIKMITRKMQLEAKQIKQQLQIEQKRNKEILMKLEKVRLELSGYRKLEEMQLQGQLNMHARRIKGSSNNDNAKEEPEIAEAIEALSSRSSTHSSNSNALHEAICSNNNNATPSLPSSSTAVIQPVPRQDTSMKAPTAVLSYINQCDGVTSNVKDVCTTALIQKQHLSASTLPHVQQKNKFDYDYDDNDDDYGNDTQSEHGKLNDCEENYTHRSQDDTNVNGDYVNNIDDANNADHCKETHKIEHNTPGKKTRMKEEISVIRKQISDDYKEREAFLDTFCRQATNGVLREETPKKRSNTTIERNIPSNRKNKLLAALKAIDDNKSED